MGFTIETSVSALTVFAQGLLSFFSPCVLPLIPLYLGYLTGGAAAGELSDAARRRLTLRNTLFFILGVSFAFFLLGLGFTSLGRFFTDNRALVARIGGVIIVLLGLVQPVLGFRGLFEAMSLVAIVALAAYLFVSRKHGTMRRRLREVDES